MYCRPKFVQDERVLTPFGSGFIDCIRPDGVYVVTLRKLCLIGYFSESAISAFPYDKVTHYIVGDKQVEIPKNSGKIKRSTRQTVISASINSGIIPAFADTRVTSGPWI